MNSAGTATRTAGRRGFTMVELLVVASIFVLLISLAVPAFSNMLYSSEQSMAENALRIGVSSARDAAARGARGEDAAAAFFYEPGVGYTIVPYVYAGVLQDASGGVGAPGSPPATIQREVFVPVAGYEPVQLPRNWMIRGFAPPSSIDGQWYGNSPAVAGNPYDVPAVRQRGNWVFPESGFYNMQVATDGRNRQTFILRFEGGTGLLNPVHPDPVLLLAPAPTQAFRGAAPFNVHRADRDPDPRRFVRRILAINSGAAAATKRQLLGDACTDTVLAKPVSLLTLYNERAFAAALGTTINRDTGCIYTQLDRPAFLPAGGNSVAFTDRINQWIEARMANADSDARIFSIHRYLGSLEDVSGTFAGVSP
jgi:prepilin-type N-terminal cleavage/methylation domain-containing protein